VNYKLTASISTDKDRCMGNCPNLVREKLSHTTPKHFELPFCSLFGSELTKTDWLDIPPDGISPIFRCAPCLHVTNRVAELEGC